MNRSIFQMLNENSVIGFVYQMRAVDGLELEFAALRNCAAVV